MGYQQKSYKKFVATAATATLVASAIVPVASAADFSDVAEDSEYKLFIDALSEQGIINGYTNDNTFRPNNKLTRGQVAIMLGRWLEKNGETVPTDWATNPRFSDVSSSNEELVKYAALVKDAEVFTGVGGKLNPNQNITRENMAVVLDRVAEQVAGVSLVELAEEADEKEVADLNKANADYRDEIQALVNLEISTVSNFRPKEEVTRAHFAKFLYSTIEIVEEVTAAPTAEELQAEVAAIVGKLPAVTTITAENAEAAKTTATTATTELAAVEKAITEGEYTEEEVAALNKVVADAKTATEAVTKKADEVIEAGKALVVESVSAINAKSLKVEFNRAADVTAADFTVNKGTVKSNVANVVVAEDKKSATIELASKLTAGDYTVTLAQKDAEALTGSVKVEDEKVAKIEILSDVAPLVNATSATVGVQVLNQYGEDITKAYAGGVTENAAGAATSADLSAEGVLNLTLKAGAKEGDSAVITLVHGTTGVSATKTVTLSAKSTASEITFGELYNKDGKTLSQDTDLTKDKFYLPITVKDQYGKAYTTNNVDQINNEILFTNTNPAVVTFAPVENGSEPLVKEVTINGEDTLALELTGTALAGNANLIAVSTTTGKSVQTSITVSEGVKISSVAVSAPTELVTAGKAAYFPLSIVDSKGNAVTTKKQLDALNVEALTVNSSYTIGEVTGKEGLYVTVPAGSVAENVPLTVVVTSTSGKVSTQTVTPKAVAVPTVITGLSKDVETALRAGKPGVTVENTDLVVEDQYGQVITDETVLGAIDFVAESSDVATITAEATDGVYTIAPAADATKTSAKVTFKLANGEGVGVDASALTKTFTIVKDSEFASYTVEDIDTVYVQDENSDGEYAVAEGYKENVVVKATTANGQVVTLEEGADYSVVGYEQTGITFDDKATTTTKTITVTINGTGEQFTKQVTYSKEAPKAAKVELVGNNTGAGVIAKTAKPTYVSKQEADDVVNLAAIEGFVDIIVTDQYGEQTVADGVEAQYLAVDTITFTKVSGDVSFIKNGTDEAAVAQASKDAVVNAVINIDGQTVTLQLTFSEAVVTP